jgi:hypothetical protein
MAADFFDTGVQKLIPDRTSASIQAVTTLRSSVSTYLFSVYNAIFFLIACFFNSSPEVTFRIALVQSWKQRRRDDMNECVRVRLDRPLHRDLH